MDDSKLAFLQSVLRYSATHSDGTTPTDSDPTSKREMSPERKKWLEEALTNISINPLDEIKKCMNVLRDEKETTERRVEALQTLRDWCEDINFAVDFHKIGGYDLIPALLNATDSAEIRALACDLIGTCAQNNPYCQETLLAARILPLVLQKLDKDTNDDVKVKALYAVSCLAREYEPGQLKLAEGNGLDIIIKSFGSPIEKLQIKCCFLCSSICTNSEIKKQLTNKKLIETLIEMYRKSDTNIHEQILSAISPLIDENPEAIRQAKEMPGINFKQILTQRIEATRDDPRFDEERQMATHIFETLFQN